MAYFLNHYKRPLYQFKSISCPYVPMFCIHRSIVDPLNLAPLTDPKNTRTLGIFENFTIFLVSHAYQKVIPTKAKVTNTFMTPLFSFRNVNIRSILLVFQHLRYIPFQICICDFTYFTVLSCELYHKENKLQGDLLSSLKAKAS